MYSMYSKLGLSTMIIPLVSCSGIIQRYNKDNLNVHQFVQFSAVVLFKMLEFVFSLESSLVQSFLDRGHFMKKIPKRYLRCT